jgi:hypothetical protein
MYAGVPTESPVSVSPDGPAALTARAIPKSVTIACPDARRMFSGFTSRWTIPRQWAYARASPTSWAMRSASSIGIWRSRVSRSRSDSPSR